MDDILFATVYRNELSEFTGSAGQRFAERNAKAAPIPQKQTGKTCLLLRTACKAVLQSVRDELGSRFDLELLHHRVLVKGDGSRGYVQDIRDLLHRIPFTQELKYLFLTRGQLVRHAHLSKAARR